MEGLVKRYDVDEVIVAVPAATGKDVRRIVEWCRAGGAHCRIEAPLGRLVSGELVVKRGRAVRLEDLLHRPPVQLEVARIGKRLAGRTVLITGGAGSVGSELCGQILAYEPRELVVFDQNESGLFGLDVELRRRWPYARVKVVVGNILDRRRVNEVLARFRPGVVFHAAAFKHVPLMEDNALEAVQNNVLGTWTVASGAAAHDVGEFVLVSTDKAVAPRSVMGASKRVAELIVRHLHGNGTRFMAARLGNVFGSAGSVVPLFLEQIARGGPITVTHPDATRFFMAIGEAAQLILQAAAMGQGGEIFVLDMGEPIRVLDLARELIRLHGLEPDEDITIEFCGLRPGEKLHERLVDADESATSVYFDRIQVVSGGDEAVERIPEAIRVLERAVCGSDVGLALETMQELVPTFAWGPHLGSAAREALALPVGSMSVSRG